MHRKFDTHFEYFFLIIFATSRFTQLLPCVDITSVSSLHMTHEQFFCCTARPAMKNDADRPLDLNDFK